MELAGTTETALTVGNQQQLDNGHGDVDDDSIIAMMNKCSNSSMFILSTHGQKATWLEHVESIVCYVFMVAGTCLGLAGSWQAHIMFQRVPKIFCCVTDSLHLPKPFEDARRITFQCTLAPHKEHCQRRR